MASSRHDADKENVPRTRIPLAKDPLPSSKNVLVGRKMFHKQVVPNRRPLTTISAVSTSIPQPGTSKEVPNKPKHPMITDTKHVTVFNDTRAQDKNARVIYISDDEGDLDDKGSQRYFVENKKKNALGAVLSAGTPNLKVNLEPNRDKNITRSLNRPHILQLQGLFPPIVARQKKPDNKLKRRLKFNDSIEDRLRTPDFLKRTYTRSLYRDYTTNVFAYLLEKEVKPLRMPKTSNITRACIINWLMNINGPDGNPAIVQTACWYFDSVLGIGYGQLSNLKLVAAACYWIAQKLNGPFISAKSLVKHSNSAFTIDKLLVAERAVMIKLNFPNQPIVPQDYITYFAWWCDSRNAGEIEVAATFLVMCGLLVNRVLCNEYPSVVAVAAITNAVLLLRKTELIPRLEACNAFIAAQKKAANLQDTCSILRRAVRRVATLFYKYKAPLEHYGMPPSSIAQQIILAATEMSVKDDRYNEGH